MSFVSVAMLDEYISVVADGKLTYLDGSTKSENFEKIKDFGKKNFVACTGSERLILEIFHKVEGYDDLDTCAKEIYGFINQEEYMDSAWEVSVIIAGINKNDEVELFLLNNYKEERFIKKNNHEKNYCEFIMLYPNEKQESVEHVTSHFFEMFESLSNELKQVNENLSIEDIRDIQIQLNNYVAVDEHSVNTNVSHRIIRKSDPPQFDDFEAYLNHLSEEIKKK